MGIVLEIPIAMGLIFSRFYKNFVIMKWGIKEFELSDVSSNKFGIPFGIDTKIKSFSNNSRTTKRVLYSSSYRIRSAVC